MVEGLAIGRDERGVRGRVIDDHRRMHQRVQALLDGRLFAPTLDPAIDEPARVAGGARQPVGSLGQKRLVGELEGASIRERQPVGLAHMLGCGAVDHDRPALLATRDALRHTPQHGVHQAGRLGLAGAPGPVDRLVDRRVRWDAIEQQQLRRPGQQSRSDRAVHLTDRPARVRGKHGLERNPPPDDGVVDGVGQCGLTSRARPLQGAGIERL